MPTPDPEPAASGERAVALVLAQHLGWQVDDVSARQLARRCVEAVRAVPDTGCPKDVSPAATRPGRCTCGYSGKLHMVHRQDGRPCYSTEPGKVDQAIDALRYADEHEVGKWARIVAEEPNSDLYSDRLARFALRALAALRALTADEQN